MRDRGNINFSLYLSTYNIAQNQSFVQIEIGEKYKTIIIYFLFLYIKLYENFSKISKIPISLYLPYFVDNKLICLKNKNGLKSILVRRFFGNF